MKQAKIRFHARNLQLLPFSFPTRWTVHMPSRVMWMWIRNLVKVINDSCNNHNVYYLCLFRVHVNISETGNRQTLCIMVICFMKTDLISSLLDLLPCHPYLNFYFTLLPLPLPYMLCHFGFVSYSLCSVIMQTTMCNWSYLCRRGIGAMFNLGPWSPDVVRKASEYQISSMS